MRSPDAAWVSNAQWENLTEEQKHEEFSPLAPAFVVELQSSSDSIEKLREKMQEYLSNGALLGWLLDSKTKQVEIYRSGEAVEQLEAPNTLSGENLLPGFVLNLQKVW